MPVAPAVFSVTASGAIAPTSAAAPRFSVALVLPSNGLLLAVTPLTVRARGDVTVVVRQQRHHVVVAVVAVIDGIGGDRQRLAGADLLGVEGLGRR